MVGLPVGLAFVIPIVIYFSSGVYRKADMEANSPDFNPMVLMAALLGIVGFTAIFYQRHQWDQYEQRYRELLARQEKEANMPGGSVEEGGVKEDEADNGKDEMRSEGYNHPEKSEN